jgi:hypothetical protein
MKTKRHLLFALFCLASVLLNAQKPPVATTKDDVIKEVQRQLAELSTGEGKLAVYCAENNVKGEFVMDLTIQGKGKLLTIYMVSSSVEDIKYQNMLKNKLSEFYFVNIKLPKNERVKFRHTLTF